LLDAFPKTKNDTEKDKESIHPKMTMQKQKPKKRDASHKTEKKTRGKQTNTIFMNMKLSNRPSIAHSPQPSIVRVSIWYKF